MANPDNAVKRSRLLTIPREVRDQVYDHLISWNPVSILSKKRAITTQEYEDTPPYKPIYRPSQLKYFHEEFIDARIDLPIKPSWLPATICRQMRAEFHEHVARAVNRDGTVTIRLDVLDQAKGAFGYYMPDRKDFSPSFIHVLPFIRNTRKLKIEAWPGWLWWSGERPSALNDLLDLLLPRLLSVEDLEVNIHMRPWSFWNFDLPVNRCEHITQFLNSQVVGAAGNRMRRLKREVIVMADIEGADRDVHLYRKTEDLQSDDGRIRILEEKAIVSSIFNQSKRTLVDVYL
jgi:hypothetical protein